MSRVVLVVLAIISVDACSAAHTSVPVSSPLARVHEGMGVTAVTGLLGPPTDQCTHLTASVVIPFYNGGIYRAYHYSRLGRVVFSGGGTHSAQVSEVEYDPNEAEYCQ